MDPTGEPINSQDPSGSGRSRVKRSLATTGLVLTLRHIAGRQRDATSPTVAWGGPRVDSISGLALDLAADDVDDENAVRQLKAAAGKRRRDLKGPASQVRMGGHVKEDRVVNRANRLLESAATGHAVRSVTLEEEHEFARAEELSEMGVDAAYERLAILVPELRELERRIVQASVGEGDEARLWLEIFAGLKPLIGSGAITDDPLLHLNTARRIAESYIARQAGLFEDHN